MKCLQGFMTGMAYGFDLRFITYTNRCSRLSQTLTRLGSTREEGEISDMSFRALSSTQPASSRASSRSTVVSSDRETSDYPPATIARTHPTIEGEESDVGPIGRRFKRPRDVGSQDESDPPLKRIRLRYSSTRTLRAVTSRFLTFSLL